MKRYILALLLLAGLDGLAQDHKTQITQYREKYMADFLTDGHSPLKKDDLQYLRFYDADSTYRVTATVELLSNQSTFVMPVFSGTGREYVKYALLKFALQGKPMELTIYKSLALASLPQYQDYLFLPFTDETNGTETYGGGRYMDMRLGEIKNGMMVIDFNKAYNPYCAFAAGYSCPKPPNENALQVPIKAGEKIYAAAKKH